MEKFVNFQFRIFEQVEKNHNRNHSENNSNDQKQFIYFILWNFLFQTPIFICEIKKLHFNFN